MDPVTEIHTADAVWIKENDEWIKEPKEEIKPLSSLRSFVASFWASLSFWAWPSYQSFVDYSANVLARRN